MNAGLLRTSGAARLLAIAIMAGCGLARVADAADSGQPAYVMPAGTPAYVRHAIELPERSAEQKGRDVNRKPAELLTLSGLKPGDRVVEFASFGQYFTTFLSDIVGPTGVVYMYDLPYTDKRYGAASRAFVATHANARYELIDYNTLELPQNLDIVFNVLYYHDLGLNDIDTGSLNARIFSALKPGGVFFIVDHNAAPGSGRRDTKALHRIDPTIIRQEVTAAGFELVTQSNLLANPSDDHTQRVFDPPIRGRTDQTIFKFRKPAK
jgi:predicted methyltransferase